MTKTASRIEFREKIILMSIHEFELQDLIKLFMLFESRKETAKIILKISDVSELEKQIDYINSEIKKILIL